MTPSPPAPFALCDYQPHPLRFVWSFLIAGLIRTLAWPHASRRHLVWVAELAIVDIVSFYVFVASVSPMISSASGIVGAWVLNLFISYPLRALVAARARSRLTAQPARVAFGACSAASFGVLAAAALSSCFVLLLCLLVLKFELQERGAALDAACYSWHISTFFLGAAFAPLCSQSEPNDGNEVHGRGQDCEAGASGKRHRPARREEAYDTNDDGGGDDSGGGSRSISAAGLHGLSLAVMTVPTAAAPFAASSVVVGAFGVLPRRCCSGGYLPYGRRRGGRVGGAIPRHRAPPLLLTMASAGLLGAYLAAFRLFRAPAALAGPFTAPCPGAAGLGNLFEAQAPTEIVRVGDRWTLLGLMYGGREVHVPPPCSDSIWSRLERETRHAPASSSSSSTSPSPPAAGAAASVGLVLAADGSQHKYADAVYVALHNIRVLQRSTLPAEVIHVGEAERFSPSDTARLEALGKVQVLDMLPRLHPGVRAQASTRLRSFASKPFAMLASTFTTVILVDANALFFSPPEALLGLESYVAVGVQLFTDYVEAYRIVDPWLVSGYLGHGREDDVASYVRITQGAECDSSVVVVDKARAWRYLHMVAALNWWKAVIDRHAWGDKDTWALAAVALARHGDGTSYAGSKGSGVGWLARQTTTPPKAVWGHVQFDSSHDLSDARALLYMNWQPHYAAGFIDLEGDDPPGQTLSCCVMLRDHWAGPHDEKPLWPTIDSSAHVQALRRTFLDARDATRHVGAPAIAPVHWWGQVRYRRCTIYFAVLGAGVAFAAASVWSTWIVPARLRHGSRVRADAS
jgi:hypothetical protein